MNFSLSHPSFRIFIAIIITGLISYASWWAGSDLESSAWYSVIPPLIAIGFAFATHNIYASLGAAVITGGYLVSYQNESSGLAFMAEGLTISLQKASESLMDTFNIQILVFAILVLTMIAIIADAGGFRALAQWLSRFAKGKRSTQFLTYLMGFLIFIDDYANTMIVGSSMRPLSKKHGISKEKLAFLVDATSAPIAGLAVISTWIGYEVGLFNDVSRTLELGQNGYAMFFDAISFRFYCIIMLVFILFNIFSRVEYGPMKKYEKVAEEELASSAEKITTSSKTYKKSELATGIVPFFTMLLFLFVGLWYDGGGPEVMTSLSGFFSLSHWREVISSSENNILILAYASVFGVLLASIFSLLLVGRRLNQYSQALVQGLKKGLMPASILVLAWSLKSICTDLETGAFLSSILAGNLSPWVFPMLLFLTASLVAISTGTSWGTMAILIPTAIPVAFYLDGEVYGLITIISLGAILDGAIMGDHCSPISDTTILSSMSTGCNHMKHVITQMPYSLTVGAIALLFGYLPAALGVSPIYSYLAALLILTALFSALKFLNTKKA